VEPRDDAKKTWETPRLKVEGKVSEVTAALSAGSGPGFGDKHP
jgi:hypothetical protein